MANGCLSAPRKTNKLIQYFYYEMPLRVIEYCGIINKWPGYKADICHRYIYIYSTCGPEYNPSYQRHHYSKTDLAGRYIWEWYYEVGEGVLRKNSDTHTSKRLKSREKQTFYSYELTTQKAIFLPVLNVPPKPFSLIGKFWGKVGECVSVFERGFYGKSFSHLPIENKPSACMCNISRSCSFSRRLPINKPVHTQTPDALGFGTTHMPPTFQPPTTHSSSIFLVSHSRTNTANVRLISPFCLKRF